MKHVQCGMLVKNSSGDDKWPDRYMNPTLSVWFQDNKETQSIEIRNKGMTPQTASPGKTLEKIWTFNMQS